MEWCSETVTVFIQLGLPPSKNDPGTASLKVKKCGEARGKKDEVVLGDSHCIYSGVCLHVKMAQVTVSLKVKKMRGRPKVKKMEWCSKTVTVFIQGSASM
jgi:hypothetical protein